MTSESAARFARVADGFTRCIADVTDGAWSRPAPCAGWVARDVVRHLCDWLPGPGFLLGTWGIETAPLPSVDVDPAGAWAVVRRAVQRGLEDPSIADRVEDCGPPGAMSFSAAVDTTCTPDVLIHTWDLARAAGLAAHEELDPIEVHRQVAGIEQLAPEIDQAMRASGHFGPRLEVPDHADELTRLLAFYGRRR